jgi:hypothetical protein
MSSLKSGERLIVSDASPKTQHKTWNRSVEKAATSVRISTSKKPPRILQDLPAMPCVRELQ